MFIYTVHNPITITMIGNYEYYRLLALIDNLYIYSFMQLKFKMAELNDNIQKGMYNHYIYNNILFMVILSSLYTDIVL